MLFRMHISNPMHAQMCHLAPCKGRYLHREDTLWSLDRLAHILLATGHVKEAEAKQRQALEPPSTDLDPVFSMDFRGLEVDLVAFHSFCPWCQGDGSKSWAQIMSRHCGVCDFWLSVLESFQTYHVMYVLAFGWVVAVVRFMISEVHEGTRKQSETRGSSSVAAESKSWWSTLAACTNMAWVHA